jgi:hypothetical protein
MVEDQEKSKLVASVVVLKSLDEFFYVGHDHKTVLATHFGSSNDLASVMAGVVFSAYAYLVQNKYCAVRLKVVDKDHVITSLARLRLWDGQQSLEGVLAQCAGRAFTTREASEKMLRELMGFRMAAMSGGSFLKAPKTQTAPVRPALDAIDQIVRTTVLPDYDEINARRTIYRMLTDFVDKNPERAERLATEIKFLIREFVGYA